MHSRRDLEASLSALQVLENDRATLLRETAHEPQTHPESEHRETSSPSSVDSQPPARSEPWAVPSGEGIGLTIVKRLCEVPGATALSRSSLASPRLQCRISVSMKKLICIAMSGVCVYSSG